MSAGADPPRFPGLTQQQASERLAEDGPNELPSARPRSLVAVVWSVLSEPMLLLLLACAGIYVTLGDRQQGLILASSMLAVVGISLFQERKTERALRALRDLSSPRAHVIRDGQPRFVDARELVRGDIIQFAEGDRVPADAVLRASVSIAADESLLTGESVPVRKTDATSLPGTMPRPGGDDLPFLYSGTMVVQGKGIAEVIATGPRTELGRIGHSLATTEQPPSPLQQETRRVVRRVAIVGLMLCLLVTGVYGVTHADWIAGLLAGLTLAMAILPEEFPVVLTVFLAIGAWRISQKQVLCRHGSNVETLGAATVLCVDKTGTLTLNRMTVSALGIEERILEIGSHNERRLPEPFHEVLEFAILASHRDPFDPMEKALQAAGSNALTGTEHLHAHWVLVNDYPLTPDLLAMSRVWRSPDATTHVIAAKGAPEAIADLCHLDERKRTAISAQVSEMANLGLRPLGVARSRLDAHALPKNQHDFDFRWIGLVGFTDPVRPTVPAAIEECRRAGIRVVMITGDYPGTALSVAAQIGLNSPAGTLSGPQIDALTFEELRNRVRDVNIYSRVVPEQKLLLVNAMRANGEVVAMTGDGVNDAPALKAAHIGIAMGQRGTDVAREAAGLVVLDDDFASIVAAIRLGRRIFDNLRKAIAFLIAVHIPIVGLSLVPVLLGLPLILLPVHIVILEFIIDPACTIVFEAEPAERDIMLRAPRLANTPLFDLRTVLTSLAQGTIVLALVIAVYVIALLRTEDTAEIRALTFSTLVIADLGLILANRSRSGSLLDTLTWRNPAFWAVSGGTALALMLMLELPQVRGAVQFGEVQVHDLLVSLAAGAAAFLCVLPLGRVGKGAGASVSETDRLRGQLK